MQCIQESKIIYNIVFAIEANLNSSLQMRSEINTSFFGMYPGGKVKQIPTFLSLHLIYLC